MKITSKTIAIISSIVVAGSAGLIYYFSNKDSGEVLGWMDSNWLYRKAIEVDNSSGEELINEDVLVEIDTEALVTSGKLQSNCNDIRFVESDNITSLDYWIEDDCNTTNTKIWIQIPSLPAEGTTIYIYYGNETAIQGSLDWNGNIIMFADNTCPTGWTRASDLDGKFLYGSDTYGTTGGSNSHSHSDATCTSSSISTTSVAGASGYLLGSSITHAHGNLKTSIQSNSSVLPPFTDMIMCYNNHFLFSTSLISMFNIATPTGWTRFSALDNTFPKGNSTYGTTGGSTTHTHTTTTGYTTDSTTGTIGASLLEVGTGADGACTVSSNRSINSTTCVGRANPDAVNFTVTSNVSAGATSVTLSSTPTGLAIGDEILIINLQGTVADSTNLGKHETAYITNIATNTLTLDRALVNGYNGTTQKIMVQRIPQYTDVTVNASVDWYPSNWNGTKGGVFSLRASGTVTVNGKIHADGMGYRGGAGDTNGSGGKSGEGGATNTGTSGDGGFSRPTSTVGVAGLWSGGGGGGKLTTGLSRAGGAGTTNTASSGGGGGGASTRYNTVYHGYAGDGGGGGHATPGQGGNGGAVDWKGYDGTTSASGAGHSSGRTANGNNRGGGGGGGSARYGDSTLSILTMGGGGGGGGEGQNRSSGYRAGANGGSGGGIVFISANSISINGFIRSNGSAGINGDMGGSGGGGAGGSIKLLANTLVLGTTRVTATGGAGDVYGQGGSGRVAAYYTGSMSGTSSPTLYSSQYTSSTYASSTHTHQSSSSTVDNGSNTPPYLNMVFAKPNVETYVTEDNIVITTELPPLGWTRFSELDQQFPRASDTYGGSGGASSHTHSVEIFTGAPSTSSIGLNTGESFASATHTHSCETTSSSFSNLPEYITVIFSERKISQNVTILEEKTSPSQPTELLCEGETTPSGVGDTTPEFSAIFNDTDTEDTGTHYQIEINTSPDFTGTTMWDSTKTELETPVTNGDRSSDISYAGNTLEWATTYYWRIKFWDSDDAESPWSEISQFTMNIPPNAPSILLTEGEEDNAKASDNPYFSAIFSDDDTEDTGHSYQIIVNTQNDFLGTNMWDSTKTDFLSDVVNEQRSSDIDYAGNELEASTTYYWKIKFWDNNDLESDWSEIASFTLAGPPNIPTDLLVDNQTNPTILFSKNPSFSAIYSDENGDSATAYQIQVNSNSLFSGLVMWDSGKTNTSILSGERSGQYTYAGLPLNSTHTLYYWRIRFWNIDDMRSDWSEVSQFTDSLATFSAEGISFQGIKID